MIKMRQQKAEIEQIHEKLTDFLRNDKKRLDKKKRRRRQKTGEKKKQDRFM